MKFAGRFYSKLIMSKFFIIIFLIFLFNSVICHGQKIVWADQSYSSASSKNIITDGKGNSFIHGGWTGGTLNLGSLILYNLDSINDHSFVACYDSTGKIKWVKIINAGILSTALDKNGNYYISGSWNSNSVDIDGTVLYGNGGCYIAKINPTGKTLFVYSVPVQEFSKGREDGQIGINLTIDTQNYLTLSGGFFGDSMRFGMKSILGGGDNFHGFAARYDSNMQFLWAVKVFDDIGPVNGFNAPISADVRGNFFLSPLFAGTNVSIGNDTFYTSKGNYVIVAKFNGSGKLLWAKQMGVGGVNNKVYSATDLGGNVYTSGTYLDGAKFDTILFSQTRITMFLL